MNPHPYRFAAVLPIPLKRKGKSRFLSKPILQTKSIRLGIPLLSACRLALPRSLKAVAVAKRRSKKGEPVRTLTEVDDMRHEISDAVVVSLALKEPNITSIPWLKIKPSPTLSPSPLPFFYSLATNKFKRLLYLIFLLKI